MSKFRNLVTEKLLHLAPKNYFDTFRKYFFKYFSNLLFNIFNVGESCSVYVGFKNDEFTHGSKEPTDSEPCVIEIRMNDRGETYDEAKYKKLVDEIKKQLNLDFKITAGSIPLAYYNTDPLNMLILLSCEATFGEISNVATALELMNPKD